MTPNPDTSQPDAGDEFVLSTGRVVYALFREIGMRPAMMGDTCGYALSASYGGDGCIDMADWTPAEREELADYMIALWTDWKALQRTMTYPLSCCEYHKPVVFAWSRTNEPDNNRNT